MTTDAKDALLPEYRSKARQAVINKQRLEGRLNCSRAYEEARSFLIQTPEDKALYHAVMEMQRG